MTITEYKVALKEARGNTHPHLLTLIPSDNVQDSIRLKTLGWSVMAPDALANLYWPMQIHLGRHPFWPVRKGKTKYKYNFLKAVRQSYFFIYHHYHCFMVWFMVWVWVYTRSEDSFQEVSSLLPLWVPPSNSGCQAGRTQTFNHWAISLAPKWVL